MRIGRAERILRVGIGLVVIPALVMLGCAGSGGGGGGGSGESGRQTPSSDPWNVEPGQIVVSGVLRGGILAIGGESTGWRLESRGREMPLDIDVSGVAERAESLRGSLVLVKGRMTRRVYPERGETPVLVVDQLVAARL